MLMLLLAGGLLALLAPAAAQSSVTISDASVTETNGDGAVATFIVTRSAGILTGNAEIAFDTADGTAHAPGDYSARSGTLFFGSLPLGGTQQQAISVPVVGDTLDEPDETFFVVLSGSDISDGEGVATITDDDPPPVVSALDAAAAPEGASATFTIALSTPSGREVSVDYETVDGSAVAGRDYTQSSGTARIAAGATSTTVRVALLDDDEDEPTETFGLLIGSPVNATRGTASATATILDTDEPPSPAAAPGASPATGNAAAPPLSASAIGPPNPAGATGSTKALRAARRLPSASAAPVDDPRHGLLPAPGHPVRWTGHALQPSQRPLEDQAPAPGATPRRAPVQAQGRGHSDAADQALQDEPRFAAAHRADERARVRGDRGRGRQQRRAARHRHAHLPHEPLLTPQAHARAPANASTRSAACAAPS